MKVKERMDCTAKELLIAVTVELMGKSPSLIEMPPRCYRVEET